MNNIEIVKNVLNEHSMFGGRVCKYSSDFEVKIVTRLCFVKLSKLSALQYFIEEKGGVIKDIEVSPMPALGNDLSIVVKFKKS